MLKRVRPMTSIGTLLLGGATLVAPSNPVQAAPADAAEASGGLEEVVVLARKREESLQDVPVAVSTVSAEALERA